MTISDATILSTTDSTNSAFSLYAAVDWFNTHPEMCGRMYRYLSTNVVMYLDPTVSRSVFDRISLRTLEECITKKLRDSKNPEHISTFHSYRRAVNTYTKSCFDMYRRHHIVRLTLVWSRQGRNYRNVLETSVAQLNLLRWLLTYGKVCVRLAHTLSMRKKPGNPIRKNRF